MCDNLLLYRPLVVSIPPQAGPLVGSSVEPRIYRTLVSLAINGHVLILIEHSAFVPGSSFQVPDTGYRVLGTGYYYLTFLFPPTLHLLARHYKIHMVMLIMADPGRLF